MVKIHIASLPRAKWQVVVRDAHIGYIPWEVYEMHLSQLAANRQAYTPQRRYLRVDPENRLVADVLEAEWNAKLRALAAAPWFCDARGRLV